MGSTQRGGARGARSAGGDKAGCRAGPHRGERASQCGGVGSGAFLPPLLQPGRRGAAHRAGPGEARAPPPWRARRGAGASPQDPGGVGEGSWGHRCVFEETPRRLSPRKWGAEVPRSGFGPSSLHPGKAGLAPVPRPSGDSGRTAGAPGASLGSAPSPIARPGLPCDPGRSLPDPNPDQNRAEPARRRDAHWGRRRGGRGGRGGSRPAPPSPPVPSLPPPASPSSPSGAGPLLPRSGPSSATQRPVSMAAARAGAQRRTRPGRHRVLSADEQVRNGVQGPRGGRAGRGAAP